MVKTAWKGLKYYIREHTNTKECTFFSAPPGTFSETDHMTQSTSQQV